MGTTLLQRNSRKTVHNQQRKKTSRKNNVLDHDWFQNRKSNVKDHDWLKNRNVNRYFFQEIVDEILSSSEVTEFLEKYRKSLDFGIFGSSINPMHKGHFIALFLISELCKDVAFWPAGAYKDTSREIDAIDGHHRLRMVQMIEPYLPENVNVVYEDLLNETYTPTSTMLKLLDHKYPSREKFVFTGEESVNDILDFWDDGEEIFDRRNWIVNGRFGHHTTEEERPTNSMYIPLLNPKQALSSSIVRDRKSGWKDIVPPILRSYILQKDIYMNN